MASGVERLGFNPWPSLRECPDVDLVITTLPAACGGAAYWAPDDIGPTILLDRGLTQIERNAKLTEELVHHRRGGGCRTAGMPQAWAAALTRDEERVHDEVARLLVPVDELNAMYRIAELNELTVEAWQVAEHFYVPDAVAERAMRLLLANGPFSRHADSRRA